MSEPMHRGAAIPYSITPLGLAALGVELTVDPSAPPYQDDRTSVYAITPAGLAALARDPATDVWREPSWS